jgi:Fe-S-cluster-containing hydrogenase component 2
MADKIEHECGACQRAVLFDPALCDGCGLCAAACPCHAVSITTRAPEFACVRRSDVADGCVALVHGFHPCESVCPHGAIQACFVIVAG